MIIFIKKKFNGKSLSDGSLLAIFLFIIKIPFYVILFFLYLEYNFNRKIRIYLVQIMEIENRYNVNINVADGISVGVATPILPINVTKLVIAPN